MIETKETITITGKLDKDINGTFDDVTKGFFIDDDSLESALWDLIGRKIKITIEVLAQEV